LLRQLGDIGRDPPRFIAAASAGINTAVLSQKRLERLTVGIPLWINTAVLSYFLADPLE